MKLILARFVLAILICGCGQKDDKIGLPVQQIKNEHRAIGLIRTDTLDCIAFLEGQENQAIAPE